MAELTDSQKTFITEQLGRFPNWFMEFLRTLAKELSETVIVFEEVFTPAVSFKDAHDQERIFLFIRIGAISGLKRGVSTQNFSFSITIRVNSTELLERLNEIIIASTAILVTIDCIARKARCDIEPTLQLDAGVLTCNVKKVFA
jgi:hypothetical protein